MPLSSDQRIISADDHMDLHVLPPELFEDRLPRALRDRGPRVVRTDDGPYWQVEGRLLSPSGRKGKPPPSSSLVSPVMKKSPARSGPTKILSVVSWKFGSGVWVENVSSRSEPTSKKKTSKSLPPAGRQPTQSTQ